MNLSLDEFREMMFDINSDVLLDLFEDLQTSSHLLQNCKSHEFIHTILNNIYFDEIEEDDDDYLSDS